MEQKMKKETILTDSQIAEIKRIYNNWQSEDTTLYEDVPELCKAAKLEGPEGIREKDFSLAPSKYIEFVDHDLDIDYQAEKTKKESDK